MPSIILRHFRFSFLISIYMLFITHCCLVPKIQTNVRMNQTAYHQLPVYLVMSSIVTFDLRVIKDYNRNNNENINITCMVNGRRSFGLNWYHVIKGVQTDKQGFVYLDDRDCPTLFCFLVLSGNRILN